MTAYHSMFLVVLCDCGVTHSGGRHSCTTSSPWCGFGTRDPQQQGRRRCGQPSHTQWHAWRPCLHWWARVHTSRRLMISSTSPMTYGSSAAPQTTRQVRLSSLWQSRMAIPYGSIIWPYRTAIKFYLLRFASIARSTCLCNMLFSCEASPQKRMRRSTRAPNACTG